MNKLLKVDGTIIETTTKIGYLIMISILWIICSLPLVTIGASTTALYYATVKTVRKQRSYPIHEFLEAFKRNIKKGSFLTLMILLLGIILYVNRKIVLENHTGIGQTLLVMYYLIGILLLGMLTYLFPVMSRFQMKLKNMIALAFVMEIRFLPYTIFLTGGSFLLIYAQIMCLPWPTIFIVPALWCYIQSYFIEKVLKIYTPKPADGEDAWYYE